jgi:peptidyl-prolyl cis-trans isomerase SurA
MKKLRLFAIVLAALVFGLARPAHAVVVERIVAVVGERIVLLSELRHRAKPRLVLKALQAMQNGMPQSNLDTLLRAEEPKAMSETLNEMIDERLMEAQADKAHLSVSVDEVDRSIRQKAQSYNISEDAYLARVKVQGYSEQDYRDEVRRQLLEGKLLQLRVAGRLRVTEEDAKAAYARVVKQLSSESPVDLQVIYMRIAATPEGIRAKEALAQNIVVRARAGESFCELVKQFNEDSETQDKCGSRGVTLIKNIIVPAAREMLTHMKEGEISDPINYANQAMIVFKLAKRERIPKYEDVREQMLDQATEEAVLHQRTVWVQELRHGVYIEIRL